MHPNRRDLVRGIAGIAAVIAAVALPGAVARAETSGRQLGSGAAWSNYRDGSTTVRASWMVEHERGGVQAFNQALAENHCSDCATTAVAFQVVLVSEVDGPIDARNEAFSSNVGCERCDSAAFAFQFVVASPRDFRLSLAGWRELLDTGAEVRALEQRDEPPGALETEIHALADRVETVLGAELRFDDELRVRRSVPAS